MNVAANLERTAAHFPDNIAIFDGDRQITYQEFNLTSNRIASALTQSGIQPGDHVALCAPNSFEWLTFYFGAIKAGAAAVTFSALLFGNELMRCVSDSRPKALFVDAKKHDLFDIFRKKHNVQLIISDSNGDMTFTDLVERGSPEFNTIDRNPDDTCAILYTGGTTGTPKGAMLSHMNLQASIFNVVYHERSTQHDRSLCFLPLNHVFAQIHIMQSTVFSGGGLLLLPCFDLETTPKDIKQFGVTKFYAVPTIYIRLLGLDGLKEKLSTIRYCFSAATSMATEVVREWKNRTGLDIHEAYGMTESASMVTYNHYYKHVIGSVGTPANLVDVKILDAEGNEVEPGNTGEICIRGPNITKGYLNNPKETQNAFWGDWFRSGDIGHFDANGYLFIVDRLKDMIITGGENVYPREVEELLYTCDEILECTVVGLPDREYGERVTAIIVRNKDHQLDAATLKAFLKRRLAGFKIPKEFIVVDELPKSNTGKILKREVRSEYESR